VTRRTGSSGFTLIEVLIAIAVFATASALAWGGLNAVIRARDALQREQQSFARIVRLVGTLERDLRAAVGRPVRGNFNEPVAALRGDAEHLELTRIGYASPRAEPRSNLERVLYELDGRKLQRGRYVALDRAPGSTPVIEELHDQVQSFRLRFLDVDGRWLDRWPPQERGQLDAMPRAIEVRVSLEGTGEITRLVEMTSTPRTPAPAGAPSPGGP
jgi:general secretion pathway protein J